MTDLQQPLEIWTARVSTQDSDRCLVARKGGIAAFAPSWILLKTYLDIKRSGRDQTEDEWKDYCQRYIREMAYSHKTFPEEWGKLLAKKRVVLTCYCVDPTRCHRRVLATILERKFGATYKGELP